MNKRDLLLRAEGAALKAIDPLNSERKLRLLGPLSEGFMRLWPLKTLHCKKTSIPRADGSKLRICILNGKKPGGKTVGVLWLHGGGYAVATPEMAAITFAGRLVKHENCVIVSPDYTLSVKKPYPAALEDAYAALEWMQANREALGIDCEKLVVGGESAGGGLTAAVCLYARDRGNACVGFQMPLYPMLDDRETATSRDNRAPVWNTKCNRAAWSIYLNGKAGTADVSPYAAPARAKDLGGLPPAITVIGTAEPFYAETLGFFGRLTAAGVKTAIREYPDAWHGFDMLAPYADNAKNAADFLLRTYEAFADEYVK